jgi:hypothetical protein
MNKYRHCRLWVDGELESKCPTQKRLSEMGWMIRRSRFAAYHGHSSSQTTVVHRDTEEI